MTLQEKADQLSWLFQEHKGILSEEDSKILKGVGLSKSSLDRVNKSIEHYFERNDKETAAMRVGSAFHELVLEPHKFIENYIPAPEGIDRRTNAGKKSYQEFEDQNPDKIILSNADWEMIHEMASSVERSPLASELLRPNAGHAEEMMMWNDEETGVLMKGRSDFRNTERKLVIDLKSTMNASPDKIEKDLWSSELRYHVQGAIYTDAARSIFEDDEYGFAFIFVEKQKPYGLRVVRIPEEGLSIGRIQYRENIKYVISWLHRALEELEKGNDVLSPSMEEEFFVAKPPAWLRQKYAKN